MRMSRSEPHPRRMRPASSVHAGIIAAAAGPAQPADGASWYCYAPCHQPPSAMSTSVRLATLLSATIVLSACGAPEVPEQMPFAEPGVEFEITPVDRNCTPDGAYVARVSWEVPQSMGSKIEV